MISLKVNETKNALGELSKNILPDKSGNPESLKKQMKQFESFSNNVPMVGENLL